MDEGVFRKRWPVLCEFMNNRESIVLQLDEKQRAHLVETYMTTELDIAATKSLMDFITEHIDELPMFFNPDLIKTEF